jgi:CsoR family transcriptional regulator, copper-sensing transcriptional repressor
MCSICPRRIPEYQGLVVFWHTVLLFIDHENCPMATRTSKAPKPTPADANAAAPSAFREEHERDVVNRLKRIEGQVRALITMVEGGRSCEDVAQQMAAARKAMDKTFYRMMACSVMEAVSCNEPNNATVRDVERSTRILEKYA